MKHIYQTDWVSLLLVSLPMTTTTMSLMTVRKQIMISPTNTIRFWQQTRLPVFVFESYSKLLLLAAMTQDSYTPRAVSRHPLVKSVMALYTRGGIALLLCASCVAMRIRQMIMKASWNKLDPVSQSDACQFSPSCTNIMKKMLRRTMLTAYRDLIIKPDINYSLKKAQDREIFDNSTTLMIRSRYRAPGRSVLSALLNS